MNKIIEVKGQQILANKENAINSLKFFYNDLTFEVSQENILRDFKVGSFVSPSRIISVIFNDDYVYFHKITLGRFDVMMPLYGPLDYLKIKKIADYFKELQSNAMKSS